MGKLQSAASSRRNRQPEAAREGARDKSMCWLASESYPADFRSPAAGRRFCLDELSRVLPAADCRDDFLDDVTLIASEFLTNSVKAGSSFARLDLSLHRRGLRLAVHDDAPGQPLLHNASPDEAHGRGIAITARLSTAWGTERTANGKQVWADLLVPSELVDTLTCHEEASPR
jgi:anti-sigma regulatory factor (Ser/Thr protein kinase)